MDTKIKAWTVSDAKAQLSKILKHARSQGPQHIGKRDPCVVVSQTDWERLNGQYPKLGAWLVDNLQGLGPLEIAPRGSEEVRDFSFKDEEQE